MAASIRQRFGYEPRLVRGWGGVFEVTWGNELLFSKKQQRRFPSPGEVEGLIEARQAEAK